MLPFIRCSVINDTMPIWAQFRDAPVYAEIEADQRGYVIMFSVEPAAGGWSVVVDAVICEIWRECLLVHRVVIEGASVSFYFRVCGGLENAFCAHVSCLAFGDCAVLRASLCAVHKLLQSSKRRDTIILSRYIVMNRTPFRFVLVSTS